MKKVFITIIFTVLITTCNLKTIDDKTDNTITITGISLIEAGLEINVPKGIHIQDPNYDYQSPTFYRSITMYDGATMSDGKTPFQTSKLISGNKKINGSFTTLVAVYNDNTVSAQYETIMVLQVFNANEVIEGNYVHINDEKIMINNLGLYIVYEDDNYFVYDFYYLLRGQEFSEFVNTMGYNDNYNYLWLKKVYKYFDLTIHELISESKVSNSKDLSRVNVKVNIGIKGIRYEQLLVVYMNSIPTGKVLG